MLIKCFQRMNFCLMNQNEKICSDDRKFINCLQFPIQNRFVYNGTLDNYCSYVFPPGYSIFLETFKLENPGPNNFVLLDGRNLVFHSEVKLSARHQMFWRSLHGNHPLRKKTSRRDMYSCVESLKVMSKTAQFVMIIQKTPYCENNENSDLLDNEGFLFGMGNK